MTTEYCVRLLTTDDVDVYKSIRLQALQTNPESFGGLYEEEALYRDEEFKELLSKSLIIGIFHKGEIIGSVRLELQLLTKIKHDGGVLGLYVSPEHRGRGAGSVLLNHLIKYARDIVLQLSLYCISDSHDAIKFYEKHGFVTIGIYPRSLKAGDRFYDSNMMFLKLD